MEKIKIFVSRLIITMILSTIAFYTVKIYIMQYLLLMVALWILLWLNYSVKKNTEVYKISITVSLGNVLSYVIVNDYSKLEITNLGIIEIIFIVILLILLTVSIYIFKLNLSQSKKQTSQDLIYKRKKDLERLEIYFEKFNIVGINGIWGSGKSFLINELKNKIRDDYNIIEIDVLTCNLNELQLILLKEIEKIMYKNGVMSKYSNKLKDFLMSEKNFANISKIIFPESYSYSETISGLKDEIKKIDNKKIAIIYEDIDRITDKKIIESIFGLSEKLSDADIKVIYQYDVNKLMKIGFDFEYLEKYIPYTINLTEISFFEALNIALVKNKIDNEILKDSDFDYLLNYEQGSRYRIIEQKLGIKNIENLPIKCSSIRKVESYVYELYGILQKENYRKYKETVISFFTIKHFLPDIYEQLNIEMDVIDVLTFKVGSAFYNFEEIIELFNQGKFDKNKINEIFSDEYNQKNYAVLRFLNLKFDNKRDEDVLETEIFQDEINNESINRVVWNLLASGKSQYTDYEYICKKIIGEVLNQPKDKQIKAYNSFWEDVYIGNKDEIDNETIFKMAYSNGNSDFGELFKAFKIWETGEKEKIALIDLYIEVENIENITDEFIKSMTFCSLDTRKEYIHILEIVSQLSVRGKLNYENNLAYFLQKYFRALEQFGYIKTDKLYFLIKENFNDRNFIIMRLQEMRKKVDELKKQIYEFTNLDEANQELLIIINFIDKVIELVSCDLENIKKKENQINVSITANPLSVKKYEELKDLLNDKEKFNKEIRRSYLGGEINVDVIRRLSNEKNYS
ncbi:P-loop NTPase fold protein [Clostridium beijerinckii]|uniref:KAP NTPase domain-containing protein n=1 Tax=Clostridium beijerinckii TaxID=1520 RepID=A0AAX0AWD6_CLOBE|nr:P-loop NTPase fold protein [Clostridium beijerinckii]NRT87283.1 hypothetical protein [Clostridium beijerinckii]NYC72714.1 hypothetical protein [Clostridium beijerinckii]